MPEMEGSEVSRPRNWFRAPQGPGWSRFAGRSSRWEADGPFPIPCACALRLPSTTATLSNGSRTCRQISAVGDNQSHRVAAASRQPTTRWHCAARFWFRCAAAVSQFRGRETDPNGHIAPQLSTAGVEPFRIVERRRWVTAGLHARRTNGAIGLGSCLRIALWALHWPGLSGQGSLRSNPHSFCSRLYGASEPLRLPVCPLARAGCHCRHHSTASAIPIQTDSTSTSSGYSARFQKRQFRGRETQWWLLRNPSVCFPQTLNPSIQICNWCARSGRQGCDLFSLISSKLLDLKERTTYNYNIEAGHYLPTERQENGSFGSGFSARHERALSIG